MRSKLSARTAAIAVGAGAVLAAGLGTMAVASAHPIEGPQGPGQVIIQGEAGEDPSRTVTVYRDGEVVDGERVTIQRDGDRVIIHREGSPDVVGVPALPALPALPGQPALPTLPGLPSLR